MLISCFLVSCSNSGMKTFELTQKASHSAGSYWEYSLSNNDVISETDYFETSFFGPGFTQHWQFEIINDGEVTIHWTAYHSGNEIDKKNSYDVTYSVQDGKLYRKNT